MTLSLFSVFARLRNDSWLEVGRQARLPKPEATEILARSIASMPISVWPLQDPTAIAARLLALRPTQSGEPGQSPSAPAFGAKAGRILCITVVPVCVACVLAFEAGVFTTLDAPKPHGKSSASFAVSPR